MSDYVKRVTVWIGQASFLKWFYGPKKELTGIRPAFMIGGTGGRTIRPFH